MKIVFLFTGLSCLILQACSGREAYLYPCVPSNQTQPTIPVNPNCLGEGMDLINTDGKWGYTKRLNNEIIVRPQYDSAKGFKEGLAAVKLNGKWGFIDKTGKVVIPFQFSEAWSFAEGLAAVKLNGKLGFISKSGKVVIPFKFDNGHLEDIYFFVGLVPVRLNGKSGVIDNSGQVIIPFKYDEVRILPGSTNIGVIIGGKEVVFDRTGKLIVE